MIHVCHEGCDHTGVKCQFCGAEVGRDGACRSCGWNGLEFTRPAEGREGGTEMSNLCAVCNHEKSKHEGAFCEDYDGVGECSCEGFEPKPAATGSGELTCHFCEKGVPRHQQFKDGPFIHYYGDTVTRPCTLPTPPASTVTLDRETFNKVMDALARAARICDLEGFDDADKEMRDALALLRAAEK